MFASEKIREVRLEKDAMWLQGLGAKVRESRKPWIKECSPDLTDLSVPLERPLNFSKN